MITNFKKKRFNATLGGHTEFNSELPLGIHWCLAQPNVVRAGLGDDGHPIKGGFMPPVPTVIRKSPINVNSTGGNFNGIAATAKITCPII